LLRGHTDNYIEVRFPGPAELAGQVAQVRVSQVTSEHTSGVIQSLDMPQPHPQKCAVEEHIEAGGEAGVETATPFLNILRSGAPGRTQSSHSPCSGAPERDVEAGDNDPQEAP
jgi:hypothetical protein